MVQWLRLHVPNAGGALVQTLVRELDPTWDYSYELVALLAATKGPVCCNYKKRERLKR